MTDPRTPEQRIPRAALHAALDDFAPGTLVGDWAIEQKIGEGGMGTVYAAVHAVIAKRAAIKVIRSELCADASAAERFVLEARLVNEIGHPNIVDIFHIGRLGDGRPYLVMELLQGKTLADRLADGRVPASEGIDLLLQMCAALGAAHGRGVIHRDLKPDNVFIVDTRSGPLVKLVDWGIAKLTDPGLGKTAMTRTGALVGTPQYLSPEQARGRDVDARADLYALGAIAYELLLEEPPFSADNVADLIAMHLREPVPPASEVWPDIPPELEELLGAMLAKAPEARPDLRSITETLAQVRAELQARSESRRHVRRLAVGSLPPEHPVDTRAVTLSDGVPIALASAASTLPEPPRRRRRRGWGLAAAAVVVAAAAVVAFLAIDRDRIVATAAIPEIEPPSAVEPAPAIEPVVVEPVVVEPPVEVPASAPAAVAPPAEPRPEKKKRRDRAERRRPDAKPADPDGRIDPFE